MLLAMVCIVLLFIEGRSTALNPVRQAAGSAIEPIIWLSALPSRLIQGTFWIFGDRLDRSQQLKALDQKIRLLEARQLKMTALESENNRLRALLGSSAQLDESVLIAEVIGVSPDPGRQYVLIDKGAMDGSYIGQVVIDSTGLVGQVIEATNNVSKVLLITDQRHAVPVLSIRTLAQLVVEGTGRLDGVSLPHVSGSLDVQVGDVLVTSGLGKRFPKGYPVATISRYVLSPGNAFAEVTAEPASQLQTLDYVLLVFDPDVAQTFTGRPTSEALSDG